MIQETIVSVNGNAIRILIIQHCQQKQIEKRVFGRKIMGFRGPEEANFENVAALNRSWLTLLQRQTELRRGLEALPAELIERITNLTATEIKRLAKTPFLLFSFREDEDAYWTRMLADERTSARSLWRAAICRCRDAGFRRPEFRLAACTKKSVRTTSYIWRDGILERAHRRTNGNRIAGGV
jgi:hypothetical protein